MLLISITLVRLHRPPPSICPSPSPDAATDIPTLVGLASRSRQAPLKALCLRRDGYRCALSGDPDMDSVVDGRVSGEGRRSVITQCAHIIPFGLRRIDQNDEREVRRRLLSYHPRQRLTSMIIQVEQKSTIWWALYRYFPALDGVITPNTVNNAQNAFTAGSDLHGMFDRFGFTLEPSVRSELNPNYSFVG